MTMRTIELFPIKIKTKQLESITKEKLTEVISHIESTDNKNILSESKSGSWSLNQDFLDLPFLNSVKTEVLHLAKEFSDEEGIRCDDIQISSSWFNTIQKGDVIRPHVHPNSFISGVIHLTYGAPLSFYTPAPEHRYSIATEKKIDQDKDVVHFEAAAGQVILFPSTLEHSVADHTADYPRHSIAFNTWPRVYGHDTARVNLT